MSDQNGTGAGNPLPRLLFSCVALAFAAYNLFYAMLSTAFPGDVRRSAAELGWLWAFGLLSLGYVALAWQRRLRFTPLAALLAALLALWFLTGYALDSFSLMQK